MHSRYAPLLLVPVFFLVSVSLGAVPGFAWAQQIPATAGNAVDCTEAAPIGHLDDPTLTRQEKIALMDAAFQRSLSRFDACQLSKSAAGAGGGSGGGGDAGGGTGAGGGASVAAPDMAGTAPPDASRRSTGGAGGLETANSARSQPIEGRAPEAPFASALNNGKVPEDIPPADNDSVLEAQIRKAAMAEKDPETREKLWDEYRKYKGVKK